MTRTLCYYAKPYPSLCFFLLTQEHKAAVKTAGKFPHQNLKGIPTRNWALPLMSLTSAIMVQKVLPLSSQGIAKPLLLLSRRAHRTQTLMNPSTLRCLGTWAKNRPLVLRKTSRVRLSMKRWSTLPLTSLTPVGIFWAVDRSVPHPAHLSLTSMPPWAVVPPLEARPSFVTSPPHSPTCWPTGHLYWFSLLPLLNARPTQTSPHSPLSM